MPRELSIEAVETITTAAGLDLEAVQGDYSGRMMFGATCISWDLDNAAEMLRLSIAISTALGDEGLQMVDAARTDSMGLGLIVYFPGYTCPDWIEPNDYEEELA